VGRRIHVGRSRNDQVAVDLRLYAKGQLLDAMDEAAVLAAVLAEFAARHAEWPMVGRTHMQPAMPSSVGCWASSFAESLLDDLALLRGAYEINDQCPLGSAAGYGVPLPIDRRFVSDLLGFARPTHNVIYAGQARGKIEAVVLSALGQAMLTLSRLAQDLILYGMPEFGYFRFPPQFGTGSSIMPQKNNPDVLELVRARAARVLACGAAVQEILRAAPSGYNRDLQETKEPFFEGLATTRACLRVLAPLVAETRVDAKALAAGFTPAVFATDRALDLVARGLPFRDAYDRVKARLGELEGADPAAAVRRKTHLGAPAGVDYGALRSRIAAARAWVVRHRTAFHAALSRLLGVAYPLAR
jgi:argininosuccinate lyase